MDLCLEMCILKLDLHIYIFFCVLYALHNWPVLLVNTYFDVTRKSLYVRFRHRKHRKHVLEGFQPFQKTFSNKGNATRLSNNL